MHMYNNNYFGYFLPLSDILKRHMKTDQELHPYWAAYFNMARLNLFSTLSYISKKINLDGSRTDDNGARIVDNEQNIPGMQIFKANLRPEQKDAAIDLFYKHFPFLISLDKKSKGAEFKTICNHLKNVGATISSYRNYYSHSTYKENNDQRMQRERNSEQKVGNYLQSVITASSRGIKERFKSNKNSSQAGMLDDSSLKFITEGRFKVTTGNDGKRVTTPIDSHFLCTSYTDQSGILQDGSNPKRLTQVGKLLLVCLFLEKQYITELLTHSGFLAGFSDKSSYPQMSHRRLLLELFSFYHIRLPKSSLSTEVSSIQIALDMLNELKKCPDELYGLLGAEDRAKFTIKSNTGENVLLKRNMDRFPILAMSYLDTTNAFKNLRFQYNAGQFRYLFKENKRCIDGTTRTRTLQEPLNGFGRLHIIEQRRKDKNNPLWPGYSILGLEEDSPNAIDSLPCIIDSRAHYIFDGDNIGLKFGDYLPKISQMGNSKYHVSGVQADCKMSKYELLGMLFHHLLSIDSEPEATENIIKSSINNYKMFFSDIAEGRLLPDRSDDEIDDKISNLDKKLQKEYSLYYRDIPFKMAEYLLYAEPNGGIEQFMEYKKAILSEHIKDAERRLSRIKKDLKTIDNGLNKPGKKNFIQIKPGRLASVLAKDIVFFQEGSATEKLTGLNYTVMQSTIATLNSTDNSSQTLSTLFKKAGLIGQDSSKGSHPFLHKALCEKSCTDTISFYINYLTAKIDYLKEDIQNNASFLHSDRIRWQERDDQYYKDLAKRYLDMPIVLPSHLWEKPIFNILTNIKESEGFILKSTLKVAQEKGRCNVTFMIRKYFEVFLKNRPQDFYGEYSNDYIFKFGHRFFTITRKHIKHARRCIEINTNKKSLFLADLREAVNWANSNPENTNQKHTSLSYEEAISKIKSAHKEYTESSKRIRRYLVQDELMFLSSLRIITKEIMLSDNKKYLLSHIGPDKDGILSSRITTSTQVTNIKNQINFFIQKNIMLKDYSEIHRLIYDNRVKRILDFHNNEQILVDDLKTELKTYDQKRVGVFADIIDYEKTIIDGLSRKKHIEVETFGFKEIIELDQMNSTESKTALHQIRNAFSHNTYPEEKLTKDGFETIIHNADIPGTAEMLANRAHNISENTPKNS